VFIPLEEFDLDNEELESWDGASGAINPPTPGEYLLRITDMGYEPRDNGHTVFVETSEVVKAFKDGRLVDTSEVGKTVKQWRTLTAKKGSRARFKNFMAATGVKLNRGGVQAGDFSGRQYIARVDLEPYTKFNNSGEEVTYMNPRVTNERPAARVS
jgi:hypothetical protein